MTAQPATQHKSPEGRNADAEGWKFVCSLVVLGLAAALVAKTEHGKLRHAAICDLVIAILSLFTAFRLGSGHWTAPARWVLALITALWLVAAILMFYCTSVEEQYTEEQYVYIRSIGHQRLGRRSAGRFSKYAADASSELNSIAYACASFATANFMTCILQWWYDVQLRRERNYREQHGVPVV